MYQNLNKEMYQNFKTTKINQNLKKDMYQN